MELSALGMAQSLSSNILEFLKALPICKKRALFLSNRNRYQTEIIDQIDVPYPMSWTDEERDISPWLGNVMQRSIQ